jgi:signal peptidase I
MADHIPKPFSPPASEAAPRLADNTNHAPLKAGTPAPAPAARPKSAPAEPKDSFREIIETVVFVVVLVLLLKSFVAEAFVIPTGSMATTLYGYQKDVKCPQCDYTFPVNCSDEVEGKQGHFTRIVGGTCPNCRYLIDFAKEHMDPSWSSGDRVLVAKYFYDTGLLKPEREDVVVFKYPQEPQKNYQPTNYIKRLIGLPGETIGIWYGKLYVLPPDKSPKYPEDNLKPEKDRWQSDARYDFTHRGDAEALLQQYNSPFEIIRKSPKKILALRRIVFDNDFQPRDLKNQNYPPRWAPEPNNDKEWISDDPNGFRHLGQPGGSLTWLRYRHILRQGPEPELITDFMGYNSKLPEGWRQHFDPPAVGLNWVGDLILECQVTVDQPDGEFVLQLSKGVDRFQARWELSSGTCTLLRLADGRETKLDSKPTALKNKGTYKLRFANVDERLVLWVDENLVFGDGVAYDPPKTRGPTVNDLKPASIGVQGANVSVRKLKLWRDTYYTVSVSQPAADAPAVASLARSEVELHKLLSDPNRWDSLLELQSTTLYVQPGHYLCLGDNSPESSDGRSWGLVPERLLLGRALAIYWPFSRLGTIK